MKSESLKLSKEMVALLNQRGITEPTPIQKEIIPAIVEGRDVIAQSETGSGKTLSFAIPIIERTNRRDGLHTLVVCPTRELAVQIAQEFVKFSHGKHLGITPIYGGMSIREQARKLTRTNIIVGTPGRLIDLLNRGMLQLDKITTLVLDEADRMLDMGFIKDIETIMHKVSKERQTLMFSATLAKEIVTLSRKYLKDPKHVQMASSVKPEFLRQTYYQTTPDQKLHLLIHLLKFERDLALVFCNRKHITAKIAKQLSREGVHARCLNGDMTQGQRERVTAEFRQKKFNVLVATDVAARGLHIDDITHVYNYEIPRDVETYTHRIGRTARAGEKGEAISLVATGEERGFFQRVLFTYKGSIVLKGANDIGYVKVKIEDVPQHEKAERSSTSRHAYGVSNVKQRRVRASEFTSQRNHASRSKNLEESGLTVSGRKVERQTDESRDDTFSQANVTNTSRQMYPQRKYKRPNFQSQQPSKEKKRIWDKRSFGEMLQRKKKSKFRPSA
ncbi:MAG: DEAD/DEAH box helicase [Bacteroidetes bacterium]|nr:DEAD/DEAH box helicase [Bacteroidota bacterium]MCW5896552.1 DEAD/DEAH box helicase [Bacteroidota bacterium]